MFGICYLVCFGNAKIDNSLTKEDDSEKMGLDK